MIFLWIIIARYEPINAAILCDRIEEIMEQTGQNGFHFVDEAAPPALMRDLALEISEAQANRGMVDEYPFEKSFTPDLCRLLKASGCIAVSGGLEVASDRLLALMKKGVTVAQVARVADAFTQAGIMVHAYLMYGFPTQTVQETIDALEMVRQLFQNGVIQSGFWHRFAMTAHSPVGLQPAAYGVLRTGPDFGGFADNDLYHEDPKGADHDQFAEGLRKSLFNYMHGVCLDFSHSEWFPFSVPQSTIAPDFIANSIAEQPEIPIRQNALLKWIGGRPYLSELEEGGVQIGFVSKKDEWNFATDIGFGEWLMGFLEHSEQEAYEFIHLQANFEAAGGAKIENLLGSEVWNELRERGLLVI